MKTCTQCNNIEDQKDVNFCGNCGTQLPGGIDIIVENQRMEGEIKKIHDENDDLKGKLAIANKRNYDLTVKLAPLIDKNPIYLGTVTLGKEKLQYNKHDGFIKMQNNGLGMFLSFLVCINIVAITIALSSDWRKILESGIWGNWKSVVIGIFGIGAVIILFFFILINATDFRSYIEDYRDYWSSYLSSTQKINKIFKGCVIFFIILLLTTIMIGVINDKNAAIAKIQKEKDKTITEKENLINNYEKTFPLIISKVEIGNITADGKLIDNYGAIIRSSRTQYLRPKITYRAITSKTITLKVKFIYPNGTVSKNDESPTGFTYSKSYSIYAGTNTWELMGWGNSTPGFWRSGNYKIEIWHENACLISQNFMIY